MVSRDPTSTTYPQVLNVEMSTLFWHPSQLRVGLKYFSIGKMMENLYFPGLKLGSDQLLVVFLIFCSWPDTSFFMVKSSEVSVIGVP